MRKKTLLIGVLMVLATAWCMNAYAEGDVTAWQGFWNSVGGFFHSAMPWNWHEWVGK